MTYATTAMTRTDATMLSTTTPSFLTDSASEVLTGAGDGLDRAAGLGALLAGDERTDEHDPLALLARDPRPVVRVGRVRQVLVLLELIDTGLHQMTDAQPLAVVLDDILDRHLL